MLIIHGTKDRVVPFWHSPELLRRFPPEYRAKPFFAKDMGHNNIETHCREEYVSCVSQYLNRYLWPIECDQHHDRVRLKYSLVIPESERPLFDRKPHPHRVINPIWARNLGRILHESCLCQNVKAM